MLKKDRGKQLTIKLLLKALMVIFMIFTQLHCSINGNREIKSVEENFQKKEQINKLIQKADFFFERQQFTAPKDANSYDLFQEVLTIEPSNKYALKKIHDIFDALLYSLLIVTRDKFEPAIREEENRGEINENIVPILKSMLNILEDLKKICKDYPKRDSDTETACKALEEKIEKYNKLLHLRE